MATLDELINQFYLLSFSWIIEDALNIFSDLSNNYSIFIVI